MLKCDACLFCVMCWLIFIFHFGKVVYVEALCRVQTLKCINEGLSLVLNNEKQKT